jgi:hypothetical protein
LNRFIKDSFNADISSTIGVEFQSKIMTVTPPTYGPLTNLFDVNNVNNDVIQENDNDVEMKTKVKNSTEGSKCKVMIWDTGMY